MPEGREGLPPNHVGESAFAPPCSAHPLVFRFAATGPGDRAARGQWAVGLGVPTATQSDVCEHGALVQVDAATGEATVIKS
jgi:hypothetical protein